MADLPNKLKEVLDDFSLISERNERAEYLIYIADRFNDVKVNQDTSTPPYPEENHVQFCESEAYVWALERKDGTLDYKFDVLNPQGLSAMAISVVLAESCSGAPLAQVANISNDLVFSLFGKEISMGKGQGLMGIIMMVREAAKQRLK